MKLKHIYFVIIFLSSHTFLYCCTCSNSFIDINHINSHKYWTKGKVLKRSVVEIDNQPMYEFTIEVLEVLKGNIESNQILVNSSVFDSACGVVYEPSEKSIYLFLTKREDRFYTGLCSLNKYEDGIDEYYIHLMNDFRKDSSKEWINRAGKVVAIGKLENGLPVGKWIEYDGWEMNFRREGEYKDGMKEGLWKSYILDTKNNFWKVVKSELFKNEKKN